MRRYKPRMTRDGDLVVPVRFAPEVAACMMTDWVGFPIEAVRLIEVRDGSYTMSLRGQQAVSLYDVPQVQQTLLAALDLAEAVEKGSDDIEERAAQVKRLASPL